MSEEIPGVTEEANGTPARAPRRLLEIPKDIQQQFAAHIALYQTDPEKAHWWDARVVGAAGIVPTLMLTTLGRKSGEPRTTTLQYFRKGDKVILGATKGGTPRNPFWFENLVVNPQCDVRIGGFSGKAKARVAQGDERAQLWDHISTIQPQYQRYQARAERIIPVVVLDFYESQGEMPDLQNPPQA